MKIFTGMYRLIFYFHDLLLKGRFIEAKTLGKNGDHRNEFDGNHGCSRSLFTFNFLEHSFHYFTYQSFYLWLLLMACNVTTETKFVNSWNQEFLKANVSSNTYHKIFHIYKVSTESWNLSTGIVVIKHVSTLSLWF